MKPILKALQAHLRAEMPELVTIAKWNNQLRNMSKEYTIATPAVYIDLTPGEIQWAAMGPGQQVGECEFAFHLVTDTMQDVDDEAWEDADNDPLANLVLLEKLNFVLQNFGWSNIEAPTNGAYAFSSLNRTRSGNDTDHDSIRDDIQYYGTMITDISAARLAEANAVFVTLENPETEVEGT